MGLAYKDTRLATVLCLALFLRKPSYAYEHQRNTLHLNDGLCDETKHEDYRRAFGSPCVHCYLLSLVFAFAFEGMLP